MWHPSAHWETSRIAAIGPRAARYGRSRPLLTLAPFTALRTRARVKKEYLPTHPWASGKTPARALRKWRATGVNQFGHTANAVWRPSRKGLASRLAALARGARKNSSSRRYTHAFVIHSVLALCHQRCHDSRRIAHHALLSLALETLIGIRQPCASL